MNQAVNIPFSIRLDAGESRFKIDVEKKYADNPNRLFGFSPALTLTPDYFSRQAFELNLDSEGELKAVTSQEYYIEVDLDKDVFDKHPYSSASVVDIASLLRNINKHYEQYKPEGFITPLVVFDWHHIGVLSSKSDTEEFYKNKVSDLYDGTFDDSLIGSDVSSTFDNVVKLNKYPFPTKANVLGDIAIRVTLAPNVTVAFSNDALPSAMGFINAQYTLTTKTQLKFHNPSTSGYKSFFCGRTPTVRRRVYATKIHTYPTEKHAVSEKGIVSTSKENERKPNLLAADYNNSINALARQMNLNLSLVHDAGEKKFKFVYPDLDGMVINLRTTPYIAHRLGFGHVTYIRPNMQSQSYPEDIEMNNVEAIAKVLVYDTGMVVVSLDQQASQQTHQFTNTVMAIMESDKAGVMATKPGFEFPRVPVSYFNPNLEFVLSKFNEANEPIPLGWKVASYIRGVLVGETYK
jgi:hypothetical protein